MKTKEVPFEVLADEARKHNIFGNSYWDLHYALAGLSTAIGEEVSVYMRKCSDRERDRLESRGEQVPLKTVYPKVMEKEVLATIKKNPLAFNGINLCDPDRSTHWTWSREVTCHCGKKFKMVHQYTDATTGILKKENVTIKQCPNPECLERENGQHTQRQWIYLGDFIKE